MVGIQEVVCKGLRYLAQKVEDGAYGIGDDAFQGDDDFNMAGEAFLADMHNEVLANME